MIRWVNFSLLAVVFVVWARAQRHAINGGAFARFQDSLSISERFKKSINIKMLLIGNHFLWAFVLVSFYYLSGTENQWWLEIVRNVFLVMLLLLIQYISIFRYSLKNVAGILFLALIFVAPIKPFFELIRMVAVFGSMLVFIVFGLNKEQHYTYRQLQLNRLVPKVLLNNFYYQILFKSGLTSSLMRLAIVAGLFAGFIFGIDYWVEDYQELTPYYLVLEAILTYFISGFYVSFLDQRNTVKLWLVTLPVKCQF